MTQYVKKRFDTAPQGCEACPRPSSPVFRPRPTARPEQRRKKTMSAHTLQSRAALWSATLRRASADFFRRCPAIFWYEGAQEVRSQSRSSRASVLQALSRFVSRTLFSIQSLKSPGKPVGFSGLFLPLPPFARCCRGYRRAQNAERNIIILRKALLTNEKDAL